MTAVFTHASYSLRQLTRQPSIWTKMLAVLPLTEVLPFLLLGSAFLTHDEMNAFFYTNLVWSFIAACVVQCLVWFQLMTQTSRLDIVLMADGGVTAWVVGFSLGVSGLYLMSTSLACAVIALVLGYQLHAGLLLAAMVLSVPVSMALVAFVLGLELYFTRIFHLINMSLDGLQVVSCVIYPLAALTAILRPAAVLSPVTWLNEVLRGGGSWPMLWAVLLSVALLGSSFVWIQVSLERYRTIGASGRTA